MAMRKPQVDLSTRVEELQARIEAIEQNQGSGSPDGGDPVRTTRRDMFRRAGVAAVGVAGAVGGIALLDQKHAAASNGSGVLLGESNFASGATTSVNNASGSGEPAFEGSGSGTGAIGLQGFGDTGGAGVIGFTPAAASGTGVRGTGATAGVVGLGTGTGSPGARGIGATGATGLLGTAPGGGGIGVIGTGSGWGVVGSGQGGTGTGGPSGTPSAPDLAAFNSGRLWQRAQESGPPNFTPDNAEMTRDTDGVMWISDGATGWFPVAVGGLNKGVFTAETTTQPTLAGSDGTTWHAMTGIPTISFTPKFNCQAVVTLTSALWTDTAGFNQDIGVEVSGGAYPTTSGQPETWTESGGFGTFSPNGVASHTVLALAKGTTYTFTAVWKASKAGMTSSQKIWAGAGPIGGKFSPTRMTVRLLTDSAAITGGPRHSGAAHSARQQRARKTIKSIKSLNRRAPKSKTKITKGASRPATNSRTTTNKNGAH